MTDPSRYNVTVRRAMIDGEELFVASVFELEYVRGYGETFGEAYEEALDAIRGLAEKAVESGRRLPEPKETEDDYSGRMTLRMPKSLHRRAALRAEHEGVSLNQLIVAELAFGMGGGATRLPRTTLGGAVTGSPVRRARRLVVDH